MQHIWKKEELDPKWNKGMNNPKFIEQHICSRCECRRLTWVSKEDKETHNYIWNRSKITFPDDPPSCFDINIENKKTID